MKLVKLRLKDDGSWLKASVDDADASRCERTRELKSVPGLVVESG